MNHRARIERLEATIAADPVIVTWTDGTRQRITHGRFLRFIADAERGAAGPLIASVSGVHPMLAELYNIINESNREEKQNENKIRN